ncbi:Hypothetical predicted protein [Mytilus galloprovincialis]|uniref:Uncharacterized protein n=1 Tax=Mytilus galloprovincialis TaxID=29158 RepID=A0A8B6D2J3_MYTGA|nr:Hypothetical predicted protein [Mytilus galloprovincialis]
MKEKTSQAQRGPYLSQYNKHQAGGKQALPWAALNNWRKASIALGSIKQLLMKTKEQLQDDSMAKGKVTIWNTMDKERAENMENKMKEKYGMLKNIGFNTEKHEALTLNEINFSQIEINLFTNGVLFELDQLRRQHGASLRYLLKWSFQLLSIKDDLL